MYNKLVSVLSAVALIAAPYKASAAKVSELMSGNLTEDNQIKCNYNYGSRGLDILVSKTSRSLTIEDKNLEEKIRNGQIKREEYIELKGYGTTKVLVKTPVAHKNKAYWLLELQSDLSKYLGETTGVLEVDLDSNLCRLTPIKTAAPIYSLSEEITYDVKSQTFYKKEGKDKKKIVLVNFKDTAESQKTTERILREYPGLLDEQIKKINSDVDLKREVVEYAKRIAGEWKLSSYQRRLMGAVSAAMITEAMSKVELDLDTPSTPIMAPIKALVATPEIDPQDDMFGLLPPEEMNLVVPTVPAETPLEPLVLDLDLAPPLPVQENIIEELPLDLELPEDKGKVSEVKDLALELDPITVAEKPFIGPPAPTAELTPEESKKIILTEIKVKPTPSEVIIAPVPVEQPMTVTPWYEKHRNLLIGGGVAAIVIPTVIGLIASSSSETQQVKTTPINPTSTNTDLD
jgi:hypothetical protein